MEIEIELEDETPFFIRPYPIEEEEKAHVDCEMRKRLSFRNLAKGINKLLITNYVDPQKAGRNTPYCDRF